ncbi:MAG: YbjN domain-containing protein [Planctomycetes bacterium]|nr:YbjN domain-containing protein [Planctomycetota bacterium]
MRRFGLKRERTRERTREFTRCGLTLGVMCLGLWLLAGAGVAQDKVITKVSNEKVESILNAMDITFKKVPGKKDGVTFFDYDRNNYKIRLHNYDGKDLWIDALFNDKTSLEQVNQWNVQAKFSRAVLLKNPEGKETISLESQMDCAGGVTDGMIRQFINRFDGELKNFVKFLSKQ